MLCPVYLLSLHHKENKKNKNMKLAEALSLRKDLQKRVEQVHVRLNNNVKVQEGDEPSEDPKELMTELDGCLKQLQNLIARINKTNIHTMADGRSLTDMIAERDVLGMRLNVLRDVFRNATETSTRYSRNEIKMVSLIDAKEMNGSIDKLSKQLREVDMQIQTLNFSTELDD